MVAWPAEELRPDLEWLLAISVPSYWTPGELDYDVADTQEHQERLERLAAEPMLRLYGAQPEVIDVRPIDVCQVPRMSRPRRFGEPRETQRGYEDLRPSWQDPHGPHEASHRSVGCRSRLAGTSFAPTAGQVQQVDVFLPDFIGTRLASMFVYTVDGDLGVVRLSAEVYAAARVRGERATLSVPDSEEGLRLLFALEEVGLAHDVLHPGGSRPALQDSGVWTFQVLRSSWEGHAQMFEAAAACGAARSGVRTLPLPEPLVEPNPPVRPCRPAAALRSEPPPLTLW